MQQYNVIATTTVGQRQQQEQLRKTTIQTTIQHVAHLLVVHVDDAATATTCYLCSFEFRPGHIPHTKNNLENKPRTNGPPQPAVMRNQTATMTTTK